MQSLDIEYTVGIATGVPITFMSAGYIFHDRLLGFLDLMNYYLDQDAPPNVITTSYGADEHTISRDLAVCVLVYVGDIRCADYMHPG